MNTMPETIDSISKKTLAWLKKEGLIACLLFGLVVLVYARTTSFDFINFDDPVYVTENPAVKGGLTVRGLAWAFGIHSDICMYYQPVAWISHMLDCQFFGLDPGKHHRTSMLLHGINVILLFMVLNAMTGAVWRSALAAAIFAVHPVNVDAVAWISERKTVLCAMFWFLGMGAYLVYVKKPSPFRYLAVLFIFTLGLLTKPVMITFPCVLVLLDFWPLGRMGRGHGFRFTAFFRAIKEKIPLFIITGFWFITPLLSETLMANETTPDMISYGLRIANALVSYCKYVITFFLPLNLSIIYPYPSAISLLHSLAALIVLVSITVWFSLQAKTRPWLLIGWLWFCGVMFPTSGLILGTLWPEMADRWAYIPFIGLCIVLAFSLPDFQKPYRLNTMIAWVLSLVCVGWLGWTARIQTSFWKDSTHIFEKALTVIDYHYLPHQNLATEYMKQAEYDRAIQHLQIILDHEPEHRDALFNMGLCLAATGRETEALGYFSSILSREPGFTKAYLMAARMLELNGETQHARDMYETALVKADMREDALYDLAIFLSRENQRDAAEQRLIELTSTFPNHRFGNAAYADLLIDRKDYEKALTYARKQTRLEPDSPRAHNRLGVCHVRLGNYDEAIVHFRTALKLDNNNSDVRLNLETARHDKGIAERAITEIRRILSIQAGQPAPETVDDLQNHLDHHFTMVDDPMDMITAYENLSTLYRLRGDHEKALATLTKILGVDSRYDTRIRYNMACLYALMNDPDASVEHLKTALEDDPGLMTYLKKDHDFDEIRSTIVFRGLIGPENGNP